MKELKKNESPIYTGGKYLLEGTKWQVDMAWDLQGDEDMHMLEKRLWLLQYNEKYSEIGSYEKICKELICMVDHILRTIPPVPEFKKLEKIWAASLPIVGTWTSEEWEIGSNIMEELKKLVDKSIKKGKSMVGGH